MDLSTIANKKRLNLLVCLRQPHTVNELLQKCDLSQSALSQHLAKLKGAGFVECTRDGNNQIYKTTNSNIVRIAEELLKF